MTTSTPLLPALDPKDVEILRVHDELRHQRFLEDIQASELSAEDKDTVDKFIKLMFAGEAKKFLNIGSATASSRFDYSSWTRNRLFETIVSHNTSLLLPFVSAWMREGENNKYLGMVLEDEVYRSAIKVVDRPYAGNGIRQFVANRAERITSKELGSFIKILPNAQDQEQYALWLLDVMGNLQSADVGMQRSDNAAAEFEEIVKNWKFRLAKDSILPGREWQPHHTAVLTAWFRLNKDVLRHGMSKRATRLKVNAYSWVESFSKIYEYCPATEWLKLLKSARIDFFHWAKESLPMSKNGELLGSLLLKDFSLKDFSSIEKDAFKNPSVFYSMSFRNHASNVFARDLFGNADGLLREGSEKKNEEALTPMQSSMRRALGLTVGLSEERLYAFLRVYSALNGENLSGESSVVFGAKQLIGKMVSYMEFAASERGLEMGLSEVHLADGSNQSFKPEEWEKEMIRVKNFYLRHCASYGTNIKTGERVKI